ncbi:putative transmembrane protein [Toxoplasma gondii TgCatPRC2]|uniref:Transmembrane protein n=2 Tax=Toxoplasma gondii TaxID=5811 RepID=A0A139Y6A8_TOXGO|nr:hypothetical protein TGARI_366590 [Toxoplasma gondii ARI]KYK70973.1 putative transmembrane protein [Toxoplasma gondii TgCatPRC2]
MNCSEPDPTVDTPRAFLTLVEAASQAAGLINERLQDMPLEEMPGKDFSGELAEEIAVSVARRPHSGSSATRSQKTHSRRGNKKLFTGVIGAVLLAALATAGLLGYANLTKEKVPEEVQDLVKAVKVGQEKKLEQQTSKT